MRNFRNILFVALAAVGLSAGLVRADDYSLKPSVDGAVGTIKLRAKTLPSGVLLNLHGLADTTGAQYTDANGLPVRVLNATPLNVDTVVRSTSSDRGGTITTGGTAQQFMAANASRRGVIIQNQSTGDLYYNCITTAALNQTSLKLPAGAIYESNPHHSGTGACTIIGATTGQAFYAREFN